ncbi:MAG: UDP-N-acetylglucosamine diphosphorylase [Candidatus Methylacidiphilales bacterium]|nr:UDP-N-acetylglucosamine diphosphorylase [Candidatus Methylacidiphilales bacterium]
MFAPSTLLDLASTAHATLFDGAGQAWEVLPRIAAYLDANLRPGNHGRVVGTPHIGGRVFIGEGTVVEPGACILGPAWIGKDCHIRHGAYIREQVIVGDGCVVGNSTEIKNSVLFNGVQVPHFSYVGDSILGHRVHLGAGVILSNFRLDGRPIMVRAGGDKIPSGLRKFGAIIGDRAEVGCHSVLNPGSVLGREALVYPGTIWQGFLPAGKTARMPEPFGKIVG